MSPGLPLPRTVASWKNFAIGLSFSFCSDVSKLFLQAADMTDTNLQAEIMQCSAEVGFMLGACSGRGQSVRGGVTAPSATPAVCHTGSGALLPETCKC